MPALDFDMNFNESDYDVFDFLQPFISGLYESGVFYSKQNLNNSSKMAI